jgi:CheY-like chemotaxis protein
MSNLILCVDDSVTMQTAAEITFRGSDFTYVGARNADEARTANANSPALILVDNKLPDGSGYDLAKELKSTNSGAIVLMLCGNSEAYDEGKGAAAGCEGHVAKPWQTDKLIEKLAALSESGPSAAAPAAGKAAPAKVAETKEPPRSATLMGMPALEMPPSKPLPAGVAAIKPSKPAIPDMAAKAPVRTPPPPIKKAPPKTPAPPPAAAKSDNGARAPMIAKAPGKPIRLVLASQAQAAAHTGAVSGGLSTEQASELGSVSRELLEQIIWEIVPDLAESIIRDNLDTLTAKAR